MHNIERSARNEPLTPERITELKQVLTNMQTISSGFYSSAFRCGNHAFIEFCGLMNEYIGVCQIALDNGVDFTECNTHSGKALPFEGFHANYLGEKLNCIYGPAMANASVRAMLEQAVHIEPEQTVAP